MSHLSETAAMMVEDFGSYLSLRPCLDITGATAILEDLSITSKNLSLH